MYSFIIPPVYFPTQVGYINISRVENLSHFVFKQKIQIVKMSEVAVQVAAASPEKKVKKAAATKTPKTKPNHPPTSEMVDAAIAALKERGGSSVLAIKKYVAATYKIDVEKLAPFIKKYIKGAVVKGHLLQTKGRGASGSFKLPTKPKSDKPKKAAAAKKPTGGGEKNKIAAAVVKKPVAAKKAVKAKATVVAKKSGTVKAKPAASKPKAAAPKKAPAPKAKKPAAKKVSAKK